MRSTSAAARALALAAALVLGAPGAQADEAELLSAQGEQHLSRLELDAARAAFERAAALRHEGTIEMGLVRTLMQAGDYRRALSFAAHTAGAHRDEAAGTALYAWLLQIGGQPAIARRMLDAAAARDPSSAEVAATRRRLADPAGAPDDMLLRLPARQAPYAWPAIVPSEAKAAASGVLIDRGRRALVPAMSLPTRLWLRDGLGRTARATLEKPLEALGLLVLTLDPPLPAPPAFGLATRPAFAGSPASAVEFAESGSANPAWPQLHVGFLGSPDAAGRQRLGITLPPGRRGGPVFDAAGRWIGIAAHTDTQDTLLAMSALRGVLGPWLDAPAADAQAVLAPDELYERAMRLTLQILVAD